MTSMYEKEIRYIYKTYSKMHFRCFVFQVKENLYVCFRAYFALKMSHKNDMEYSI